MFQRSPAALIICGIGVPVRAWTRKYSTSRNPSGWALVTLRLVARRISTVCANPGAGG
jgi:hypothetical protein